MYAAIIAIIASIVLGGSWIHECVEEVKVHVYEDDMDD